MGHLPQHPRPTRSPWRLVRTAMLEPRRVVFSVAVWRRLGATGWKDERREAGRKRGTTGNSPVRVQFPVQGKAELEGQVDSESGKVVAAEAGVGCAALVSASLKAVPAVGGETWGLRIGRTRPAQQSARAHGMSGLGAARRVLGSWTTADTRHDRNTLQDVLVRDPGRRLEQSSFFLSAPNDRPLAVLPHRLTQTVSSWNSTPLAKDVPTHVALPC